MNESLGTDLYSEGESDNWVKQASVGIDKVLEATGLPALTEQVGRGFGELVGNPEAGAAYGKDLPRMAVNVAPMLLATTGVGAPIGMAASAALSGAQAYTATGSPAAGVTSGLLNIAMPAVAGRATQAALKTMGGEFVEEAARYFPTNRLMGAAGEAAGQLAAGGVGVGADVGSQLAAGQQVHISPTEQLLNLTLGQVPFAGMYLGKQGRVALGGRTTRAHIDELRTASKLTEDATNYAKNKAELDQRMRETEVPPPPEGEVPPGTDLKRAKAGERATERRGWRDRSG